MNHPVWILQAFDRQGTVIGTISKQPNGPIILDGTPDAFALCLPDLRQLDHLAKMIEHRGNSESPYDHE